MRSSPRMGREFEARTLRPNTKSVIIPQEIICLTHGKHVNELFFDLPTYVFEKI